jgi:hypothetical protein
MRFLRKARCKGRCNAPTPKLLGPASDFGTQPGMDSPLDVRSRVHFFRTATRLET